MSDRPTDQQVEALIDSWADAITYGRTAQGEGSAWSCTLHMHDAENIVVGSGPTRRDAEIDALRNAGKLPRGRKPLPSWPLTAAALAVAGFAGTQAALQSDWLQTGAAVVAMLTAVRLITMRL